MVALNFDANQVEPATSPEPVPAGKYLAAVANSMMKPIRTGAGAYLELEYQILDGVYKGRKLWSRHTLEHVNPLTVQIARGELSAICRAVGVMTLGDSSQLHNMPLTLLVRTRKREDNGELTNEVVGWAKAGAAQDKPAQAATTPPWLRR